MQSHRGGSHDTTNRFLPPDDPVSAVWSKMTQHGLRHIPVIDDQSRPVGVVNARDALQALLTSAADDVEFLHDYMMSMGYH